jgi:hypothetical protein
MKIGIVAIGLLLLCGSGCEKTPKPDASKPDASKAIQAAQKFIADDLHESEVEFGSCDAYCCQAPKDHSWRVTGNVAYQLRGLGFGKGLTSRPFSAEVVWDGTAFHKDWIAVGRQSMERHER